MYDHLEEKPDKEKLRTMELEELKKWIVVLHDQEVTVQLLLGLSSELQMVSVLLKLSCSLSHGS